MPNDRVNVENHMKISLINTYVITENAKLRKELREVKHHKHIRQLTPHQFQLHTIIIKPINTFIRILLVIHLVLPATYVIDYDV
jgi:hypothetical protein